jgi:SAM-dependent methyltransferase
VSPRPSQLESWPRPFDPRVELDWGDPVISRRLLREHLDQSHDGASRRGTVIDAHVRRLARLLPRPPARILDAASGPGLYAIRLAAAGHSVVAVDIGPAVVRHARTLARSRGVGSRMEVRRADLRTFTDTERYDAVLLIYHVLEGFPRRSQPAVLRRLAAVLAPRAPLIVEMRLRPDQPDGRISSWDVVPASLLSDRRHLLLVETVHDRAGRHYVLRETAVFDDGSVAIQQTSSALSSLDRIPALFARAGLRVDAIYDGWSRFTASSLSDTALVVSRQR